jgi:hypothetical protein
MTLWSRFVSPPFDGMRESSAESISNGPFRTRPRHQARTNYFSISQSKNETEIPANRPTDEGSRDVVTVIKRSRSFTTFFYSRLPISNTAPQRMPFPFVASRSSQSKFQSLVRVRFSRTKLNKDQASNGSPRIVPFGERHVPRRGFIRLRQSRNVVPTMTTQNKVQGKTAGAQVAHSWKPGKAALFRGSACI